MSSSRFEVQRLRRAALAEHEAGFALSRALLPRGAQQLRDRVRLEARSGMPIVGPATGTASDPDPVHLEAAAAPASASSRGTAARPNRPSSSLTATLRRSSAMRPSLARSRNSAAAGRLCDCGLRQVVGLSPRQVLDPPSIFPPGVHERREDGGLAGAGDADRYAESSALPKQLDHPHLGAPVLRRFEADAGPRDGRGDQGRIGCPGAVHGAACARPISSVSRFTCKVVVSAPRPALRIRGKTPDRPDGLPFLAHARARRRRA